MKIAAVKPHFAIEEDEALEQEVSVADMALQTFRVSASSESESENNAMSEESDVKDGIKRFSDFLKIKSQKETNSKLSKKQTKQQSAYSKTVYFIDELASVGSKYSKAG